MENIAFGRKTVKRFDLVDLKNELEAQGLNVRKVGRELKFKVDGDSYVLNPGKGVWIGSAGAGTIAGLLRSLKIHTSDLPLAPRDKDVDEEARKFADMQRRIREKINESRPLRKTEGGSQVIARPFLQKIVSDYLTSRGLDLELLPEDARVKEDQKGFVELIIPLSDNENALSIHVTALDDNGKHGLDWIGGDCRYSLGPISGYFSVVDGATEQLKIKGNESTDWIAIAEGLETSMSIRLLTGWTTIFAISAGNLTKILTPEMAKNMVREKKGLAIAVDRDQGGAGQKASATLAKIAKEQGIPVLFLVPPAVVKGSEKGADWNDAVKELDQDGAFGALTLAIARSDEELSALAPAVAPVLPMDLARDSSLAPAPVERKDMEEVHSKMWSRLKRHLDSKENAPGILAVDAGSGKSQTLADLSRDHAYVGSPVVTIAPTKELAAEAASKSQGFFREGRSERPENAGFCPIYPDIEPFSERWRSVVAHKCVDCKFGKAAMAVIRGEEATGDDPCQYILHVNEARQAPVLSTTGAMLEGDPFIGKVKDGDKIVPAKVVLDDTAEISDHRAIHGGHIAEWIRAANRIIETSGENKARAEATKALLPWLSSLSRLLADNPGEEQIRLSPSEWTEFSTLVRSSALKWVDGITAEAIFRDSEGNLEIPLRTLKSLGEALARGTAWVRKGVLHFAVATRAVQAIKEGALILDATPSMAVRAIVEAQGGDVTEIRARQDSLKVTQVLGAGHGKTACSPESPSFEREKMHFLNTVRTTAERVGSGNLAVLTHKTLADALSPGDLPEGVEIGHWGLDDRGHNRWERKTTLMIWGVQRLSPSTAERIYMAERQAVSEAGGAVWPEWDGTQAEKWYQVPGQPKEIFARGYSNDFIDQWSREWTTAKVVQAVGRLRATRRTEPLEVVIHSNFPLSEAFGMEIHALARPDWRTMNDYQKSRKDGQTERGMIAIAALGEDAGRRKINDWLKAKGLPGIKPENWGEIKKMAGGSRCEYSSFVSGTTPDFFGRDADKLIAKLEEWAKAGDPRDLVEMTDPSDDCWTPVERAALLVFDAVFRDPSAFGGLPDPVPVTA